MPDARPKPEPPPVHGPSPAAITAPITKTGEPADPRALVSTPDPDEPASRGRRRHAVEAYCRELDPAGAAAVSAEQILSSLTGGISDDNLLLQSTRTAAVKELAQGRHDATSDDCDHTPARLAARANSTLPARERSRLEEHLVSCLVCRAAELRSVRADRAFAAILALKLTRTH
jgi:anti-sigma factor RsiW